MHLLSFIYSSYFYYIPAYTKIDGFRSINDVLRKYKEREFYAIEDTLRVLGVRKRRAIDVDRDLLLREQLDNALEASILNLIGGGRA